VERIQSYKVMVNVLYLIEAFLVLVIVETENELSVVNSGRR